MTAKEYWLNREKELGMTGEEAIEIIKQDIPCEDDIDLINALGMAIKALSKEPKILDTIDFAIHASNGDTNYFVGFRNGLRYSKSLIDGEEPQFESCAEQEPSCEEREKGECSWYAG